MQITFNLPKNLSFNFVGMSVTKNDEELGIITEYNKETGKAIAELNISSWDEISGEDKTLLISSRSAKDI